jgi:hypothetical protein
MARWDESPTYEDLQTMTPAERHEHSRSRIVWDVDTLHESYRKRLEEQNARVFAREERLRAQLRDPSRRPRHP